MNKSILIGRLTADPDLRQTQSGISCVRFTVACNRKIPDKNTGERKADFINCVAWRSTAEFIHRYFKKGSSISVEGTMQNSNYEKDGVKHFSYIVVAENVEFTGSKSSGQATQHPASQTVQQRSNASQNDFDLSDFEDIICCDDEPF